jgi:tetratricopeptide (TPR) repeat protein
VAPWLVFLLFAAPADRSAADRLYAAGQVEEAAGIYRRLLHDAPGDLDLLIRLGTTQYQLGVFAEAESLFRKAVSAGPGIPQAQIGLGMSLVALDRSREAIPFLEKSVKLAPKDRMAFRALGHAYLEENEFLKGEQVLKSLVASDRKDWESSYYLGALLYENNYYLPALEALSASLELQPANEQAEIYKAGALSQLGRTQDAADLFQALATRQSAAARPELWLGYAQFLYEDEKLKPALDAINRAIALSRDSAKLLFWRARVLMSLGDVKAAESDAEKAVELAPELPNSRNLLMKIYRTQGLDQAADAQAAWLAEHKSGRSKVSKY